MCISVCLKNTSNTLLHHSYICFFFKAANKMNGFRMYFANDSVYGVTEKCFEDSAKQAYLNLNQSIECELSPTYNVFFFNRYTIIELCYIEISGSVLTIVGRSLNNIVQVIIMRVLLTAFHKWVMQANSLLFLVFLIIFSQLYDTV